MSEELKFVPDDGKKTERIIVCGEAPGYYEAKFGKPFVGPSGQLLDKWMTDVGLSRKDAYWTNVFPYQPPRNNIHAIPKSVMLQWADNLHDRIAELKDPWLIVPTGNTSLMALTGKKEISKHRGSIYEYVDRKGRHIKCIPTFHPAYTFRRPVMAKECIADWKRIAEEVKFRELRLPVREYYIAQTLDDFKWFHDTMQNNGGFMAIDAEWTPDKLLCCGFSVNKNFSFTIPTTIEWWKTKEKLAKAIDAIKRWCENSIPKVLQHGHSDAYVLKRLHDININAYEWDLLAMHHCLDANRPHTLEYMASIDTRQQYWKDEAKDPESIAKYATNYEALLTYNGMDCCVTQELFDVYYQQLMDSGKLETVKELYMSQLPALIRLMLQGIPVDERMRIRRRMRHQLEVIELQDQMGEIVGEKVFATKSLRGSVLQRYFYETLALPKQYRVRKKKGGEHTKTITIDEVAVRRLMLRFPKKLQAFGDLLLKHRRQYQLMTFYG